MDPLRRSSKYSSDFPVFRLSNIDPALTIIFQAFSQNLILSHTAFVQMKDRLEF